MRAYLTAEWGKAVARPYYRIYLTVMAALAAALAVLGLVLYHFRDRSLSDTERARRILGAAPKGDFNGEEAGKTV